GQGQGRRVGLLLPVARRTHVAVRRAVERAGSILVVPQRRPARIAQPLSREIAEATRAELAGRAVPGRQFRTRARRVAILVPFAQGKAYNAFGGCVERCEDREL